MNIPTFAHQPINTDLKVAFGPINLMSRFFLKALDHAARRGVTLSFISFEDLLVINEMNLPTWQKLTPAFDLNKSHLDPDRSFCIVGRNAAGEIVYTHALKLFDWTDTNVKAEIESLRMFYADPAERMQRGEAWRISSNSAATKTGRVVYGGAIWCRPDYRKGRLSTILPRIVWSYAYVNWNYDYLVGVITEANVKGGFPKRMGYTDVDMSVTRFYPPDENGNVKQINYALVTMTPAELIDGNFTYLLEPIPQVEGTVHAHSA